jgi:hypothetical protein
MSPGPRGLTIKKREQYRVVGVYLNTYLTMQALKKRKLSWLHHGPKNMSHFNQSNVNIMSPNETSDAHVKSPTVRSGIDLLIPEAV